MQKRRLSNRESQICQRLRDGRERADVNQSNCAARIGIKRTTLANYENEVTPLPWEVGLRFCRQCIISEEWLATGAFAAMHKAGPQHGIRSPTELDNWNMGYSRQCLDLLSEPICQKIPRGALFSEAFDHYLAPRYEELAARYFFTPRIVLTDVDDPKLMADFLRVILLRWLDCLKFEAVGGNASFLQRQFTRCMFEAGDFVFKGFMGKPASAPEWLRQYANNPGSRLGSIASGLGGSPDSGSDLTKNVNGLLTTVSESGNSVPVKDQLPDLIDRLRKATSEYGMKSRLAESFGVPLASISQWLSGEREPGGETTLRLLNWVESQEQKQKSPGGVLPPPGPKTQFSKSHHEKPKPSPG